MALTKKQKQVFDYICDYIDKYEYSPTQVEIKNHFGLKSLGSVQDYIRYLKNSGHLKNDSNSARGLKPVRSESTNNTAINTVDVPLYGKVAAGNPIEEIQQNETISIPSHMVSSKDKHFALTVSGESMIEDGILDGDIIIVKSTQTAKNGQTIIASIDNEATVKKYYLKNKQVELHPANSSLSPIIVNNGNFQIKGLVVGLYRSY